MRLLKNRRFFAAAVVGMSLLTGCSGAVKNSGVQESTVQAADSKAQNGSDAGGYPEKNITFIIPFAAGGGTDSLMRMVGSELETVTGHSVVINNLPGNGGAVGMTDLTKAEPDGYTIAGSSIYDVLGSVYLGGDTVKFTEHDFQYVCGVNVEAEVFIANPATGFEKIEDMIDYAIQNPGKLTVSTSGNTHNMLLGILEDQLGVKVTNIAYSGGGDSFNALMGGHVDVALIGKKFASQVDGTDFKVLCAMSPEELSSLPGVPAFCKVYPEVELPSSCRLIVAPKDTPDAVVDKLEALVKEATDTDAFRAKMTEAGELYQFTPGDEVEKSISSAGVVLKSAVEKNPSAFGLE